MANNATISSNPQLVVLDVSTDNYQWFAPVNNTTANQPPGLVHHNAELYQDTMIVVFGKYVLLLLLLLNLILNFGGFFFS